jgi:hypothetical protein
VNQNNETRALSADLAALVSTSGRLFTLIRSRTWDAGRDPEKAVAAIRDIMAWSDAAHNLSIFGARVQRLQEGGQDGNTLGADADALKGALIWAADKADQDHRLMAETLRDAARIVTRISDQAILQADVKNGSLTLLNAHDRDVGSKLLLDGEEIGRADYDRHGRAGLDLLVSMAHNIARVTGRPFEMVEVDNDAFDPEP